MPRYRGELDLEDTGPEVPVVHLFDYSSGEDQADTKSFYRKQLVALDSCIFVGSRNLAQAKAKAEKIGLKSSKGDPKDTRNQNETGDIKEEGKDAPVNNGHVTNENHVSNGDAPASEEEVPLLKEGQEFEGYFLKCPNGPFDYAMKIWDKGRAAPKEVEYPSEGEEVEGLVVDRCGDYLTIACGPNIAYATRKSFLFAGVDPDDLSLPFARLRVCLTKVVTHHPEVAAAEWLAHPTQVVVAPFDIC